MEVYRKIVKKSQTEEKMGKKGVKGKDGPSRRLGADTDDLLSRI